MSKTLYTILSALACIILMASCNDTQTYAEQKEHERNCINSFLRGTCKINDKPIKVIGEAEFRAKGEVTDVSQNEFVLFNSTGIYMQIVNKGTGKKFKKIASGENVDVLCRFYEYNINEDALQLYNDKTSMTSTSCDKMTVLYANGTFTASFSYGMMPSTYGSTSVPSGWLIPLTYIKLGRPAAEDEEIAHVRIIVPHNQGHAYATRSVYACYYDITYEKGQ